MDSLVQKNATAGLFGISAPTIKERFVHLFAVTTSHPKHLAHLGRINDLLHALNAGMLAMIETIHQDAVAKFSLNRNNFLQLGGIERRRFFGKDMLTSSQTSNAKFRYSMIWRTDKNSINLRIREDLLLVMNLRIRLIDYLLRIKNSSYVSST